MSTNLRDTLLFSLGSVVLVVGVVTHGETDLVGVAFHWLTSFF